jgi:tetratricopeptide (TPR) repeat protein
MAEADAHFAAAHERMQALGQGSSAHAVTLLNNWSVINERAGDARRAQELAERALALAGTKGRSPFLLINRARALEYQGRFDAAVAGYGDALAVAEATATVPVVVGAHLGIASARLAQGRVEEARAALGSADAKASALPPSHPQRILRMIVAGRLASSDGHLDAAQDAFRSAIDAAPQQATAVMARLGLAEIALQRGAPQEALELARAARAQAERLQGGKPHSFRTALATVTCAGAQLAAGDEAAAGATGHEALALLAASVDPDHPAVEAASGLSQAPSPGRS